MGDGLVTLGALRRLGINASGGGALTLSGNLAVGGTLAVTGTSTHTGLSTFTAGLNSGGSVTFTAIGTGPILKQGANGRVGTFVCNGVTPVSVSNTSIAVTDAIIVSLNTVGGTVGALPSVKTITASTGFTIAGSASDTSTYNYAIIKNAA